MRGPLLKLAVFAFMLSFCIGVVYSQTALRNSDTNATCVDQATGLFNSSSCKGSFVKVIQIKFTSSSTSTTTTVSSTTSATVGSCSHDWQFDLFGETDTCCGDVSQVPPLCSGVAGHLGHGAGIPTNLAYINSYGHPTCCHAGGEQICNNSTDVTGGVCCLTDADCPGATPGSCGPPPCSCTWDPGNPADNWTEGVNTCSGDEIITVACDGKDGIDLDTRGTTYGQVSRRCSPTGVKSDVVGSASCNVSLPPKLIVKCPDTTLSWTGAGSETCSVDMIASAEGIHSVTDSSLPYCGEAEFECLSTGLWNGAPVTNNGCSAGLCSVVTSSVSTTSGVTTTTIPTTTTTVLTTSTTSVYSSCFNQTKTVCRVSHTTGTGSPGEVRTWSEGISRTQSYTCSEDTGRWELTSSSGTCYPPCNAPPDHLCCWTDAEWDEAVGNPNCRISEHAMIIRPICQNWCSYRSMNPGQCTNYCTSWDPGACGCP